MTKNATHIPIYGFSSRETVVSHMSRLYIESEPNRYSRTRPALTTITYHGGNDG